MTAPLPPNGNPRTSQADGTNTNTSSAASSGPQVRVSNALPATGQGALPPQSQRAAAVLAIRRQLQQSAAAAPVQSHIALRYLDQIPVFGTQRLPELVTQNRAYFRNAANMQQYVEDVFPMDRDGVDMTQFNLARSEAITTPEMRAAQRMALEPILLNLGVTRVRGTREIAVPSSFDPNNSTLLTTPAGRHCLMQIIRSLYLLDNIELAQNLSDVLGEIHRRYPQLLTANHALLISSAASDNFWQAVDAVNTRTPMPLPAPYRPAID
ncbi:MAG: hypothetical protein ACRC9R_09655, partial [Enterovibrio sp.]